MVTYGCSIILKAGLVFRRVCFGLVVKRQGVLQDVFFRAHLSFLNDFKKNNLEGFLN